MNRLRQIPTGVWILGFVSMLMDISSEMIHSLLPLFMATSLGMGAFAIGLIEGIAESTALIIKVFSGVLSDYIGKRKGLAVLGYGLGAASKPLFALANWPLMIFCARFVDRIGKGIRGAPRDALVADVTPAEHRGAAYGLRQSLDTVGAFMGPLLAALFMFILSDNFRSVFWIAVIPGVLAVILLVCGLKESPKSLSAKRTNPIKMSNLKQLSATYWRIVVIGSLFSLARFSEAFLVLRAHDSGIALAFVPFVMVIMNLVYSLTAYPAGTASDKKNPYSLLCAGMVILGIANLFLANAVHWGFMLAGVALWGVHMGMTQGLMAAMIANHSPENLRGTAFGFFNLVSGIAMLIASITAGFLWEWVHPAITFYFGAILSIVTIVVLRLRPV